jgi:predicted transcriptional regulator
MSNVRISDETHSTLRGLADLEGQTMQTVLDKAVECYRRSRFWDEVETVAGRLRGDQAAWNDELEERQAWEATLADGLDSE